MDENFDNKLSLFLDLECFDVTPEEFEKIMKIVPDDYYFCHCEEDRGYIRYWFVEELEDSTPPREVYADDYLRLLPPRFASGSSFLHSIISEYSINVALYCHGDNHIRKIDSLLLIPVFHVTDNALSYIKEYDATISFVPIYYLKEE